MQSLSRWLVALCALCLTLSACAREGTLRERLRERAEARRSGAPSPADYPRLTAAGDYSFKLEHDGLTRHYRVHVPRSLRSGQRPAVLLAFHGGGGNMNHMADDDNYGLIAKSESAGFVVVFANGYSALPGGGLATWNAGECCGSARDKDVDDVGFVRKVLADLESRIEVDTRRVFATGMSNGGLFAYRLACEMPDRIHAIAAVAGTDNTRVCNPTRPIPVLHIHAKNDTHVLFEGGAGQDAFRDVTKVTQFTSVPETIARWTRRNGCEPTPKAVLERPGAYCERYSPCKEGATVQLCVTAAGGHSWPGASKVRRGKEPASQALSANDVMWDFFQTTVP